MAVISEVMMRGISPAQYDTVRERARWLEQPPEGWSRT